MSEPTIAKKGPYVVELEAGSHWFCTCGKSATQPFCDGAHKDSGFGPMEVKIAEKKKYAMCGCKHSRGLPFCDATHAKFLNRD